MTSPIERAESAYRKMRNEVTVPCSIIAGLTWLSCLISAEVAAWIAPYAVLLTVLAVFFGAVSLRQRRQLREVRAVLAG